MMHKPFAYLRKKKNSREGRTVGSSGGTIQGIRGVPRQAGNGAHPWPPRARRVPKQNTGAVRFSSLVFPSIRGNKVYPAADSWEMSEKELAPTAFSTEGLNVATLGHDGVTTTTTMI